MRFLESCRILARSASRHRFITMDIATSLQHLDILVSLSHPASQQLPHLGITISSCHISTSSSYLGRLDLVATSQHRRISVLSSRPDHTCTSRHRRSWVTTTSRDRPPTSRHHCRISTSSPHLCIIVSSDITTTSRHRRNSYRLT